MYNIYCMRWKWDVEANEEDVVRYSLKDLTGDGFPELIMGYYSDYSGETTPGVVYYYSETEGIKKEHLSDYYTMTLYEGGIIEYISGGVNYMVTYLQFQQDIEEWIVIDEFSVETIIDGEYVQGGANYYRRGNEEGITGEPILEEEYNRIIARYTQKQVQLEWTPVILGSEPAVGSYR